STRSRQAAGQVIEPPGDGMVGRIAGPKGGVRRSGKAGFGAPAERLLGGVRCCQPLDECAEVGREWEFVVHLVVDPSDRWISVWSAVWVVEGDPVVPLTAE